MGPRLPVSPQALAQRVVDALIPCRGGEGVLVPAPAGEAPAPGWAGFSRPLGPTRRDSGLGVSEASPSLPPFLSQSGGVGSSASKRRYLGALVLTRRFRSRGPRPVQAQALGAPRALGQPRLQAGWSAARRGPDSGERQLGLHGGSCRGAEPAPLPSPTLGACRLTPGGEPGGCFLVGASDTLAGRVGTGRSASLSEPPKHGCFNRVVLVG